MWKRLPHCIQDHTVFNQKLYTRLHSNCARDLGRSKERTCAAGLANEKNNITKHTESVVFQIPLVNSLNLAQMLLMWVAVILII